MSDSEHTHSPSARKALRVLCITLSSDRPESESFIGLRAQGIDLHIMCEANATHLDRLEAAGVPVTPIAFNSRLDKSAVAQIRTELIRGKYDILHLYHNKPVQHGLRAARGVPVKIVAYRGIVGNVSFFDPVSWQRYLNPRVDRIICVCNAIRDYFLNMNLLGYRLPENKPVRIYKGHKLAWYDATPANLTDLGLPADAFVICCVANWRPRKGIEVLVRAMGMLPPDVPAHLLLIGNMDNSKLKRAIDASPAAARIHLLGYRADAPALSAACDVAVLPSLRREGLPRSVIEAMAYAVAPVVTDSGGSPELVQHGNSGLVVRSGDAADLASALLQLYENPDLRKTLGQNARQRIDRDFRIETTIDDTAALYRELLA